MYLQLPTDICTDSVDWVVIRQRVGVRVWVRTIGLVKSGLVLLVGKRVAGVQKSMGLPFKGIT